MAEAEEQEAGGEGCVTCKRMGSRQHMRKGHENDKGYRLEVRERGCETGGRGKE